jgi:hypothetical protein
VAPLTPSPAQPPSTVEAKPPTPTEVKPPAAHEEEPPAAIVETTKTQPSQVKEHRRETGGGAGPSREALLARINILERDGDAHGVSDGARRSLEKLRAEAEEAHDAASRRDVAIGLNRWESFWLKRKE